MNRFLGSFLSLLAVLSLPASAKPPETKQSSKGMTYSLRVPDNASRGKHTLVVGLHGAGDNCQNFMRWIEGPQSTFPKDAILLAPQALANGAWDVPDGAPLEELVREVKRDWEPVRTIGFGFSRGSYYIFALAFAHPDLLDGAIPCGGGLPQKPPDKEDLRKLPFWISHGDADPTVPVTESEKAFQALEALKVPCKFDRIAGLKHTVDWASVKKGLDWIGGILDERQKASESVVAGLIDDLEASLKSKDWGAAAGKFGAVERVPSKLAPRLAALAKPHVQSADEPLALAAIAAAGRCGPDGASALKGIPGTNEALAKAAAAALGATGAPAAVEPLGGYLKTKHESVAVAAADALAKIGTDPALQALVSGLSNAEALFPAGERVAAIIEAPKKATGQTFAKSKDWKKWLSDKARAPK